MSHHIIDATNKTGQKVTVTLGYDRTLDHLFCNIVNSGVPGGFEYTSHTDIDAIDEQEVSNFRCLLEDHGILLPDSIFDAVDGDQANGGSNRLVLYNEDGSLREEFTI